jgi:lysophospholipase L1-like esterase
VGALTVLVIGWVGYELSQWPPAPPSSAEAVRTAADRDRAPDRDAEEATAEEAAPGSPGGARPARWVLLGDSYAAGAGAQTPGETGLAQELGRCLGVRLEVEAEGSAGYVSPGRRVGDRAEAAVSARTDAVVFAAGLNDRAPVSVAGTVSVAELRAAAREAWGTAEAAGAEVVVVGPFWPAAAPDAGLVAVRDALAAEARAQGHPFVDPTAWLAEESVGELVDPGSGYPTQAGHTFFGQRMAAAMQRAGLGESAC